MMKFILGAAAAVAILAACLPRAGASNGPATIPAALQGRWGINEADCDRSRADAKGLMEVGPGTIRFYESRGKLRDLIVADPTRLEADFDFTGEGQTWERRVILDLEGGTLTRRDYGDGADPTELDYQACTSA